MRTTKCLWLRIAFCEFPVQFFKSINIEIFCSSFLPFLHVKVLFVYPVGFLYLENCRLSFKLTYNKAGQKKKKKI